MKHLFIVFIGGGLGTVARFLVGKFYLILVKDFHGILFVQICWVVYLLGF